MYDDHDRRPGISWPILKRWIFNLLTIIVFLATLAVGGVLAMVMANPYVSFNPYPPPTLPPTLGPPTPTNTPEIFLPPTWTATITFTPGPTSTPTPTFTATLPTLPALDTPTPPSTSESGAQFDLQEGSPAYISDERGCDVMGVGGKVFDLTGAPIAGLAVRMSGELAGQSMRTLDSLTGSAADRFGFGGYYFELADTPIASQGTLWIQVLDASSGLPLSNQEFLDTFNACDRNLVLVNWQQVQP
jgi:hypothetical protein